MQSHFQTNIPGSHFQEIRVGIQDENCLSFLFKILEHRSGAGSLVLSSMKTMPFIFSDPIYSYCGLNSSKPYQLSSGLSVHNMKE